MFSLGLLLLLCYFLYASVAIFGQLRSFLLVLSLLFYSAAFWGTFRSYVKTRLCQAVSEDNKSKPFTSERLEAASL
jgi:hypothetical protein